MSPFLIIQYDNGNHKNLSVEVNIVKISRTITLELEDVVKINDKIKNQEIQSLSEFIQRIVKNELMDD